MGTWQDENRYKLYKKWHKRKAAWTMRGYSCKIKFKEFAHWFERQNTCYICGGKLPQDNSLIVISLKSPLNKIITLDSLFLIHYDCYKTNSAINVYLDYLEDVNKE